MTADARDSSRMDSVIVGLIGVAAGALATGGAQFLIAWLDRRRDARTAARLLSAALIRAAKEMAAAEKEGHFIADPAELRDALDEWRAHRSAFGTAVNAWQWNAVAWAFHVVKSSVADLEEAESGTPLGEFAPHLKRNIELVELGGAVLWAASANRRQRRVLMRRA